MWRADVYLLYTLICGYNRDSVEDEKRSDKIVMVVPKVSSVIKRSYLGSINVKSTI